MPNSHRDFDVYSELDSFSLGDVNAFVGVSRQVFVSVTPNWLHVEVKVGHCAILKHFSGKY